MGLKFENGGKMWLEILRMITKLTKNREHHHQKQFKICKNARKRGHMKTENRWKNKAGNFGKKNKNCHDNLPKFAKNLWMVRGNINHSSEYVRMIKN